MSDRWIPVLAATVGVIGGLGGALIGGCVANQGQQEQFENERQAALVDMRREVYATYLQAVDAFIQVAGAAETDEERKELIDEEVEALTAAAAAELVAEDDLRKVVQGIDKAIQAGDVDEFEELRTDFIKRAHEDIFRDE